MQSADDTQLLTEFTTRRSEEAFATLVNRHINLVYSAALRQVQNPQLAQEVTQVVFIILAQKAHTLRTETILSGWLYRTARFAAANVLKKENRRQRREQEAHMQSTLYETDSESIWENISPLLDEAMSHLGEKDRDAVILRYFEEKSLSEVGVALGTNEDTARKRVSRSVEKLRKFFTKRGTVLPAATLIGLLSANSVSAAPAGLASSIAAGAILKGTVAASSTLTLIKGTLKIMAWTKMKTVAVVGAAVILGGGTTLVVKHSLSPKTLKIKAFIDGIDTIKIQNNRIWYEHEEYNLPGDPQSRNEPTIINGSDWHPQWKGQTSVAFEGFSPAFQPASPPQIKLTKLTGRGDAFIKELPTPENNRTLSIYFHDDDPGADWYEVIVEWK